MQAIQFSNKGQKWEVVEIKDPKHSKSFKRTQLRCTTVE
jgi:hypothetical protein